jgi:hypothetical protein
MNTVINFDEVRKQSQLATNEVSKDPYRTGCIAVALLRDRKIMQQKLVEMFPDYVNVTQEEKNTLPFDPAYLHGVIVNCRKHIISRELPAEKPQHMTEVGSVIVTPKQVIYQGVEDTITVPVNRGMLEAEPVKVYAAVVADQAHYSEKRDGTSRVATFVNTNESLGVPNIVPVDLKVDLAITGEVYRKVVYENCLKDPRITFFLEDNMSKNFPASVVKENKTATGMGVKSLKQVQSYIPPTPKGIKLTTSLMYNYNLIHTQVRGEGNANFSTACCGFYLFSMTKLVWKDLAHLADTMSILQRLECVCAEVYKGEKLYGSHWLNSLKANRISVAHTTYNGLKPSPEGYISGDTMNAKEKVQFEIVSPWKEPTSITTDKKAVKVFASKSSTDITHFIEAFIKSPNYRAVEVHIVEELRDYVDLLYPSSRGDQCRVWLTNQSMGVFKQFEEVLHRSCEMMSYKTHFPFTRRPYIDVDSAMPVAYKNAIVLNWFSPKQEREALPALYGAITQDKRTTLPAVKMMHLRKVVPQYIRPDIKQDPIQVAAYEKKLEQNQAQIQKHEEEGYSISPTWGGLELGTDNGTQPVDFFANLPESGAPIQSPLPTPVPQQPYDPFSGFGQPPEQNNRGRGSQSPRGSVPPRGRRGGRNNGDRRGHYGPKT